MYFISSIAFGQSPYARFNNEFRHLFDNIPIDKGQEKGYFDYAKELFRMDSVKKAGQIFDRVYWLDTTSEIAKEASLYRSLIESNIKYQARQNLFNSWNWGWSGSNWGASETQVKSGKTKKIKINDKEIRFYTNDTLVRATSYTLIQLFDWRNGYLTNLVKYDDNNEEWFYRLNSIDTFTSDYLWIEQKTSYVCGNYGESYKLDKTTANSGFAAMLADE
ncbi:MAG TPA: hypothetical protein PLH20_16265 [Flavobacterium sp.]|nr:hypothetical protein [Flavobacterium sp.]